jgi:hypothetical protein
MKALTIWQPWASLIMAGAKPWEWRGWTPPRSLIGQRIVIHASARAVKRDEICDIIGMLQAGDSSLVYEPAWRLLERAHIASYPLAAGLGTAILGEPIPALAWAREHHKGGIDSDRIDHHGVELDDKFAWPLTQIESFEPVVPMRGAQGFWTWPERVMA